MRKTVIYERIRKAIIKEPNLLDNLTKAQAQVVKDHYKEGLTREEICDRYDIDEKAFKKLISSSLRKMYQKSLALLASNKENSKNVDVSKIWCDPDEMKSFMSDWVDISRIIEVLAENPNIEQRNLVVKSIFLFSKDYQHILERIINHPFVKIGD